MHSSVAFFFFYLLHTVAEMPFILTVQTHTVVLILKESAGRGAPHQPPCGTSTRVYKQMQKFMHPHPKSTHTHTRSGRFILQREQTSTQTPHCRGKAIGSSEIQNVQREAMEKDNKYFSWVHKYQHLLYLR